MNTTEQPTDGVGAIHPIELADVTVKQLTFVLNTDVSLIPPFDSKVIQLAVREDPINTADTSFEVTVRAAYGIPGIDCDPDQPPAAPFSLLVELSGKFVRHIDLSKATLEAFQRQGAMACLAPYIREHVYSLSSRCGMKPILIPLLQVPVIRVAQTGEQ